MKIEAVPRAGRPSCGPPIDSISIDTENGAPQIYAVGYGDDHASAARLRRADLSTTTCCALSENETLQNAVEGGDACTLSAEARLYGYVSNVLAKQELRVDRGMNRGESWSSKGTREASDILESATGLPECRS